MTAVPSPDSFIIEVEQEVLGTLMNGGDFRRVANILTAEHFVEGFHRVIYQKIAEAQARYGSTVVTIVAKLIPEDMQDGFRLRHGLTVNAYLAKLVANIAYGSARLEEAAKKVVEQWARLAVAAEAERLGIAAADPSSSPSEIVSTAAQTFDDILSNVRRGPSRKTRSALADAIGDAFLSARAARERGSGLTGVTWGLTDLNRLTGGIQRRDLTLVGARPSMGKTTFATSVGLRAAKSGVGVGFISLEMDREKVAARAASDLAYDWNVMVPYVDIIRGTAEDRALEAAEAAIANVAGLPLWIDDQSGIALTDVRVKTESLLRVAEQREVPLGVLIIDHLGLLKASSRYAGNRTNEIAEMTSGLKALAREYDIAVVLLSQLNRALEQRPDKRPQLSDLRDSGAIEQDADTILFLHREAYYLERQKGGSAEDEADRVSRLVDVQNLMEIEVAKQRNGPVKRIEVFADMGCSAIRNGARQ